MILRGAIPTCVALALLASSSVLPVSCRHPPRSSPSPAAIVPLEGVVIGRCGDIATGPTCRVDEARQIAIVLPPGVSNAVFRIDDRRVDGSPARLAPDRGFRTLVQVPDGASRLEVSAAVEGVPAVFAMALATLPPSPAWLEEGRRLHRAGDPGGAMRLIERGAAEAQDAGDTSAAGAVASYRAKAALKLGDTARAVALFETAAQVHRAHGEISAAVDDESARAYVLTEQLRELTDARVAVARMRAWSADYPEGLAWASLREGEIALATGDFHAGLAALEQSSRQAERLGEDDLVLTAEQSRSLALFSVGRVDEAAASLMDLERKHGDGMAPCDHAALQVNLGWAALLAREDARYAAPAMDPKVPLRAAIGTFETTCVDRQSRADAILNLAWAHLEDSRVSDARDALAEALRSVADIDPMKRLFALDLEGRIALASHDVRGAARAYETLVLRSAGVSASREIRAYVGLSEAHGLAGRAAAALAAIERAEEVSANAGRDVALGEGRGELYLSREQITARHVSLLLGARRAGEALNVARTSRAQVFEDERRVVRTAQLSSDARATWETSLAA